MKRPDPPSAEPAEPTVDAVVATPAADQSADPTDWQKRVRDAQAALTRKSMENADLRRRLAEYETDDDDESGGDDDAGEPAPVRSRFRSAEPARPRVPEASTAYDAEAAELGRAIAAQVHGRGALRDFDRVEQVLESAQTVSDKIAAMEAWRDLRARSAQSAAPQRTSPAGGRQARDEAVQPRVETNRPDTIYPSGEPDPKRFEGGLNGGVGGWLKEKFAAGRNPR